MSSHDTATIYPEREDTELLARHASAGPDASVLDLGCGNGRIALEAARSGSRVVATDLNPFALQSLRGRALALGLEIDLVRTDLARGLGRFDVVLANPPYLPTEPASRDPDRWTNVALDGGPDGCRVLSRVLLALPAHLRPGGRAYVLVSSVQRASSLARLRTRWTGRGGTARVVAQRELEGERLEVWELTSPRRRGRARRRDARRGGGPPRGTGGRRPIRATSPSGSSRAPARGRTTAPGAASSRRRSRRGW